MKPRDYAEALRVRIRALHARSADVTTQDLQVVRDCLDGLQNQKARIVYEGLLQAMAHLDVIDMIEKSEDAQSFVSFDDKDTPVRDVRALFISGDDETVPDGKIVPPKREQH